MEARASAYGRHLCVQSLCALARQACRNDRRLPWLLEGLALAHADGAYTRLLGRRLAKVDVLVLDDWALAPRRDQERREMLEIFYDRHAAHSAILPASFLSKAGTITSRI